MDNRKLIAAGYLAWYIVSALIVVIVLAWGMQDEAWWKSVPVLLAYASLVYGGGCWFCRHARNALRGH